MKRTASLILIGALAAGPAAADDARRVVDCMRANVPAHLVVDSLELTTTDRGGGTRTLKGRLFAARDTSANPAGLMSATLRIDAPTELKGAAYHVRETNDYLRDGMFVYLPAVKRVRRITGTFADASLMGTNFSYFDFKQMQNAFGDLSATVDATEHINGRPASVLRFKGLPGAETRYSGVRAWIDEQSCVAVRAEFLEGTRVVKELTSPAGALKQVGKHWYVAEYEMRDPLANTKTVLKLARLDVARAPAARYFDPTSFHLGP